MFGQNSEHASSSDMVSTGLDSIWEFDADAGFGNFSPTIAGGAVYVGTLKGDVYILDLESGKSLGSNSFGGALFASPAIADSLMIVASSTGKYNLLAYNIYSGKTVWSHQLSDIESSPTIAGDFLYVTTLAGDVYKYDAVGGKESFHRHFASAIRVSPLVTRNLCVFGSEDGKIICIDAEKGNDLWSYDAGSPVWCTSSAHDSLIFTGTNSGELIALDMKGAKLFDFKAGGKILSMPISDGSGVYFGSNDGTLYAISATDGRLLWRINTDAPIIAAAAQDKSELFVGGFDRFFYVINKSDGMVEGRFDLGGRVRTAPAICNGYLVVCAENTNVFGFRIR
ncbi:MAG TPA: PQQ-binding-like beta-propeller repeat protein [Candidatus Kryptonia bacterium]